MVRTEGPAVFTATEAPKPLCTRTGTHSLAWQTNQQGDRSNWLAEEGGCPGGGGASRGDVGKDGGGSGSWGPGKARSVGGTRWWDWSSQCHGGRGREEMVGDEAESGPIVSSVTRIY